MGIDLIDWEGHINSYEQTVLLWKKDLLNESPEEPDEQTEKET